MANILSINIKTIFWIVSVFFLECLWIYIWFVKWYLPEKRIRFERFIMRIKEFRKYRQKLKRKELIPDEKMSEFLEKNERIYQSAVWSLAELCIFLFIYALLCTVILQTIFSFYLESSKNAIFILGVIFAGCMLSLFMEKCVKYRKDMIERLDELNHFFVGFDRLIKNIDEREKTIKEKQNKKNINRIAVNIGLVFFSFIIAAPVSHILITLDDRFLEYMRSNMDKWNKAALLVAFVCIVIIINVISFGGPRPLIAELKKRFLKNIDIKIDDGLSLWKDEIQSMCMKLEIRNVDLSMVNRNGISFATSSLQGRNNALIVIDSFALEDFRQYVGEEACFFIVKFMIGHELAHIRERDSLNWTMRKSLFFYFVILFVTCGLTMLISCLVEYHEIFTIAFNVFLFLSALLMIYGILIQFKLCDDKQYWDQIQELRADRTGFQLSGISIDMFRTFAAYCKERREPAGGKMNIAERSIYPIWDTRIKELEDHGDEKWSFKDRLRYFWRFFMKRKLHIKRGA